MAQDASTVLATVNGTDITLGHMIALRDRLPEQYQQIEDGTLYEGMLDQLIQQTALKHELEKDLSLNVELGRENEIRAFMAGEMLSKFASLEIPEAEIEAAYAARFADVEPAQQYDASHILVETEDEALQIKTLLDDGADFAELAKEHSTGPSGPGGGALGWFGAGQMVPEFEQAVLELEDGAVSEPVQTQFGFHVIKRNASRAVEAPSLEETRGEIEQELRAKAVEVAVTEITEAADVNRAELEIDPSFIRQIDLLQP